MMTMGYTTTDSLERELDHAGALLRIKELEEQLRSNRVSTLCSLAQLLDLKDLKTGCHGTRLAEWAVRIARELRMNEQQAYAVEVAGASPRHRQDRCPGRCSSEARLPQR